MLIDKKADMPWSKNLPYGPLRAVWIFLMLIFGSVLTSLFEIPAAQAMLVIELLALIACVGSYSQLGIRNLEGKDFIIILLFYAALILLSALASYPWELFLENSGFEAAPKQEVLNDVANAGWRDRIFMYLAVCVVTPVVEEVLFRRIIFGGLAAAVPPFVAVIITSFIFAIVHFFIKGLPALFVMGMAFQLIYLMRKNLFSAILLHALVNSVAFFANVFPSS